MRTEHNHEETCDKLSKQSRAVHATNRAPEATEATESKIHDTEPLTAKKYEDFCLGALRSDHLRITNSRKCVIAILATARNPLSPKEILEVSRTKNVELDLVTIYRILEKFESLELVHQVQNSGSYLACMHFDCSDSKHVMVICRVCGKAEEHHVPFEVVSPFIEFLKSKIDFAPEQHVFQVDGKCSSCDLI